MADVLEDARLDAVYTEDVPGDPEPRGLARSSIYRGCRRLRVAGCSDGHRWGVGGAEVPDDGERRHQRPEGVRHGLPPVLAREQRREERR